MSQTVTGNHKPTFIRLPQLSLPLRNVDSVQQEQAAWRRLVAGHCRCRPEQIRELRWVKKSLDARNKEDLRFVATIDAALDVPVSGPRPPAETELPPSAPAPDGAPRPVVVGAGPAGLFAALLLAERGRSPLVIEQGRRVERRQADVERFWRHGQLDVSSNIQFGEGGAGAFSDGKLTSRSKDPLGRAVLKLLIAAGADPSVSYWHKPHLGSDKLPAIIANLRQRIISQGGEFYFETTLTGLEQRQGRLTGLSLRQADGAELRLPAQQLILAVGNAGRQVYRLLAELGVALEAKPFAVGFRIQQQQALIDRAQYGGFAGHPLLGAADYALSYQERSQGRGVYTFCNCPGGHIVNAASEKGGLVVNGVSLAARDSGWANAAAVAQVFPGRDFGSEALDGLDFQQRLEHLAFELGGGDHSLPVTAAEDFIRGQFSGGAPAISVKGVGTRPADLSALFSAELACALRQALGHWERQLPGFSRDAVLAGVESRTSAPLRILRGPDRQSLNLRGLFPAGEGAGYAGGIVSSAIDGLRAALALMEAPA